MLGWTGSSWPAISSEWMAPWLLLLPWLLAACKHPHCHHLAPHSTSLSTAFPRPLSPAAARRLLLSGTPLQNGKDPSSALQAAVYQHPPDGALEWITAEMEPAACCLCRLCAARTPLRIPASPLSITLPSSTLLLPTDLQELRTLLLPRSVLACCASLHLSLDPAPPPCLQTCRSCGPCSTCCCRRSSTTRRCLQSGLGRPSRPHRWGHATSCCCCAGVLWLAMETQWGTLPGSCKPLVC